MGSFFSTIAQHIAIIFTIITVSIMGIFNHGNKIQNQPVAIASPITSESAKPSPTNSPAPKIKKSIFISSPQPTTIPSLVQTANKYEPNSLSPTNPPTQSTTSNPNSISTPNTTQFQLTEDDFTYDFNPKTLTKSSSPQKIDFTLTFLKDFDYGQITSITFYLIDTADNINRTPTFMRYMFDKNQNKTVNDSMTALFNNSEMYVMNKILVVYKDNETSTINLTRNLQYLEIK